MYRIIIKGDIQGNADVRLLEGYLRQLVESATGAPISTITFHGIARQRISEIREMLNFRPSE